MKQELDPRLHALAAEAYAEPVPENLTLEMVRDGIGTLNSYNTLPYHELAFDQCFDFKLGKADCRVQIFHPQPDKALPILFFFPGTGFSVDCFEGQSALANNLAKLTHCVTVSVTYRLAPENPYPAAIDDCEEIILQRETFFKQHNILADYDNYAISGCSSGTYIAATVIQRLINLKQQQHDIIMPKALHLHVPVYDFNIEKQSIKDYAEGYFLDLIALRLMYGAFTQTDPKGPFITPEPLAEFAHKNKFPTTLITYAGCDPLKDDALLYYNDLRNAGVSVDIHELKNMPHSISQLNSLVPEVLSYLTQTTADFFKQHYA